MLFDDLLQNYIDNFLKYNKLNKGKFIKKIKLITYGILLILNDILSMVEKIWFKLKEGMKKKWKNLKKLKSIKIDTNILSEFIFRYHRYIS